MNPQQHHKHNHGILRDPQQYNVQLRIYVERQREVCLRPGTSCPTDTPATTPHGAPRRRRDRSYSANRHGQARSWESMDGWTIPAAIGRGLKVNFKPVDYLATSEFCFCVQSAEQGDRGLKNSSPVPLDLGDGGTRRGLRRKLATALDAGERQPARGTISSSRSPGELHHPGSRL